MEMSHPHIPKKTHKNELGPLVGFVYHRRHQHRRGLEPLSTRACCDIHLRVFNVCDYSRIHPIHVTRAWA